LLVFSLPRVLFSKTFFYLAEGTQFHFPQRRGLRGTLAATSQEQSINMINKQDKPKHLHGYLNQNLGRNILFWQMIIRKKNTF
jgi:hypothetical protein